MKKIAIIGTGGISNAHIRSYLEIENETKIVALVDIIIQKAIDINEKYNLDALVYSSTSEMFLNHQDIDVVNICTPPSSHAELAILSMNNNTHVIVEKPMAVSLEECDLMIETSLKTNKILAPVAQNRFTNDFYFLQEILKSDIVGKNLFTSINSAWFGGLSYYDLLWRGTWISEGGGAVLSQGIHHIDALLCLKGKPSKISAFLENTNHNNSEVEDLALVILKYENKTLAQFQASVISHGEEQEILIQTEKARISKPYRIRATKTSINGFPEKENDELILKVNEFKNNLKILKYENHPGQINNVLNAIDGVCSLEITPLDGKNAIELITAIYKSHQENEIVNLPLLKNDTYYTKDGMVSKMDIFYEKTGMVTSFDGEIIVGASEAKK